MLALQPPPGFIHLVLLPHEETPFYLEISVDIIAELCLKPRKYLQYLGWCVLGAIGVLTDDDGEELELSGGILDQAIYHYAVPLVQDTLSRAVGLEATRRPSSSREDALPAIREADWDYGTKLRARDGRCVWSSIMGVIGVPIIPHERGDEWLRLIIANGPSDEGLDPALRTVDFENGFCASPNNRFGQIARDAAVLKTPNPILDTTDVPARRTRLVHPDLSYPLDARYTLQWLFPADPCTLSHMPNNRDATFLNHQLPRPADLLLHYNYGAAAVKNWGKNVGALDQLPLMLSPHRRPIEHPADEAGWDEDDVILFLWSNSRSVERYVRAGGEHMDHAEECLAGVGADGWPAWDGGSLTGATGTDGPFSEDDGSSFDRGNYS